MARKSKAAVQAASESKYAVRALLAYQHNEPTVELEWASIEDWTLARIARMPPKGLKGKDLIKWRGEQPFTPTHHWLAVPDADADESSQGYVRKDKLQTIRALKPTSTLELVRPRAGASGLPGVPYLRVTWTAATGRLGWLSFFLDRPSPLELVLIDRQAVAEAREQAQARRRAQLAALEAAGDDGTDEGAQGSSLDEYVEQDESETEAHAARESEAA